MKARFLVPARAEFDAAIDYYESQAAGLGAEFLVEVEHCVARLLENSEIGAPHIGETRRVLLTRFPCGVVYLPEDQEVVVVAVAHHRREPGY